VVRYLSLDWIDALGAAAAANERVQEVAQASPDLAITQVVSDGPDGDVMYHLSITDGTADLGPGAAAEEQVRLVQDWDTAVAVATGTLSAQDAFIHGRIRIVGDAQRLLDAQPLFAALEGVFAEERTRTDYA
jgi:hypothetical protein